MPEPVTIPREVLGGYKNLYMTARSLLELAEPTSEDEALVNTDNLEDLKAAHLEVYRQLNHGE